MSETRSLVVERLMAHPPEKIWRALTESALVADWLMQNDFEPRVGHRFNFRARPIPKPLRLAMRARHHPSAIPHANCSAKTTAAGR